MTPDNEGDGLDTTQETPNEGLEAEADAEGTDREVPENGDDLQGAAEGDGADAEEGQVDGQPERRPSRGEVRFQKLSQTAREANEKASRLEAEANELKARLARLEQPRQPTGPSAEELALMTPEERSEHRLNQAMQGFERQIGAIAWQTQESQDKAAFQALTARNPVAARLAGEVERRLGEMRQKGQNVDRERLFTYLVGEEVLAKAAGAKTKQAAAGQQRIARQQTRPGAPQRSDTPSNRGRMSEQEAREKRLENITF